MKVASPLIVKTILGKMFLRVELRAPGISKEQEAEADIPSFVLLVQMWGLSSETGIWSLWSSPRLGDSVKDLVKVLAVDPRGFLSSLHNHGSQVSSGCFLTCFQKKMSTHIQDLSPNTRRHLLPDIIYGFWSDYMNSNLAPSLASWILLGKLITFPMPNHNIY